MKDVITKLREKITEYEGLVVSLKEQGFTIPSDLVACIEESQFITGFIAGIRGNGTLAETWKNTENAIIKYENDLAEHIRIHNCADITKHELINVNKKILLVLERTFPEEVKAIKMHSTPVVTITPQMVSTIAKLCGIPPLSYNECTPDISITPESAKAYAERVRVEYKEWKHQERVDPTKNPTEKLRRVVNALFEVAPGAFHDIIYNPSSEPSLGPKIFMSSTWQHQYNNLIKEMQKLVANTRK
jgi:hypothetical protein